ncbi:hypothetical protein C0557_14375 [Kosakonia sp. MUSA4]|nr:hypothetical protein C0557_14375 [Kosakonia sp. MUSA4]
MTMQLALIILNILFILLLLIMTVVTSRYFKRHEVSYNELLTEYRSNGFDLDLVTNYSSFFGSLLNHHKIIYFVRLYKGVKMKFAPDRNVQPEAYAYIQQLPQEKMGWILRLHRLYMIQHTITGFWLCEMLIFIYLYG